MRKATHFIAFLMACGMLFFSCTKNDVAIEPIPQTVLNDLTRLGFSTDDVVEVEDGYVVEGDVFLSHADLEAVPTVLRVPQAEQYHTFNLVSGTPRTITISVDGTLPSIFTAATQEAIDRYNAENLELSFQLVASNGNIRILKAPRRDERKYLASAGFPTNGGNPYSQVKVSTYYLNNNSNQSYVATILAHEVGHCIGFRHTDWFDRSYSCGGSPTNEGQSTSGVGAVHIPGTPTGADNGSFMLSCIGNGQNRPFNNNDKTALDYLY